MYPAQHGRAGRTASLAEDLRMLVSKQKMRVQHTWNDTASSIYPVLGESMVMEAENVNKNKTNHHAVLIVTRNNWARAGCLELWV